MDIEATAIAPISPTALTTFTTLDAPLDLAMFNAPFVPTPLPDALPMLPDEAFPALIHDGFRRTPFGRLTSLEGVIRAICRADRVAGDDSEVVGGSCRQT